MKHVSVYQSDAYSNVLCRNINHNDVIKWKHLPRYWPFVRGFHRSPVNSLHKGQWRGTLMFSLICVWINGWVNNREVGDLRRYRAHYDVIVMMTDNFQWQNMRSNATATGLVFSGTNYGARWCPDYDCKTSRLACVHNSVIWYRQAMNCMVCISWGSVYHR